MADRLSTMRNAPIWNIQAHAIMLRDLVATQPFRSRWRTTVGLVSLITILWTSSPVSALAQSPTETEGIPIRWLEYGSYQFSSLYWNASELADGSHGEVWTFDGRSGDYVKIIMHPASFDALLVLRFGEPSGEIIALDDDSYAGTDALILVQLPSTGPYFITAATADGPRRAGDYWIGVEVLDPAARR
jgi:hypothetical protein